MNIEELKQEYLNTINEIENEIVILQSRLEKAKAELINARTAEDIERFRRENDLEEGLEHIALF